MIKHPAEIWESQNAKFLGRNVSQSKLTFYGGNLLADKFRLCWRRKIEAGGMHSKRFDSQKGPKPGQKKVDGEILLKSKRNMQWLIQIG